MKSDGALAESQAIKQPKAATFDSSTPKNGEGSPRC